MSRNKRGCKNIFKSEQNATQITIIINENERKENEFRNKKKTGGRADPKTLQVQREMQYWKELECK